MNFAPLNVLEFDGAFPQLTIASWLPTFTQPGRLAIYADGTTLAGVQVVVKIIPGIPDPWRATTARSGPAPKKGAVIREPAGIVSSPPIFAYQAPPALPSNAGYTIVPVPDPWRGTSTKIYGPFKPFIIPQFLSWEPTFVQPGRPILRAAGTSHVKDDWRFPEAVSADKWQATIVQPSRSILRASGTSAVDRLLEIIFADRWQPIAVQPSRSIVRAKGTEFTWLQELSSPDKWQPTWTQPVRQILGAKGTDLAEPLTVGIFMSNGICNGRLTLTSGDPIGTATSGTTLYFTPHLGSYIGLFDGSSTWNFLKFAETSIAIPAPTGVYDLFAYNNAGTMALEFGNVWTTTGNGTMAAGTRSQALTKQDGVWVKSGATTRRYLGTIYSASGTASDSATLRGVWNYYNRIVKKLFNFQTASSWVYGTAVWRAANANASSQSQVQLVVGMNEDFHNFTCCAEFQAGSSSLISIAIGYDSTTNPALTDLGQQWAQGSTTGGTVTTQYAEFVTAQVKTDIGLHTYYWLELVQTANVTFLGQASFGSYASGIVGTITG